MSLRTIGGGETGVGGPQLVDAVNNLQIIAGESNVLPTEDATFVINLLQSETNIEPDLSATLDFPSGDFGETNDVPTEARAMVVRSWATGCTSNDANLANPGNANGANDAAFCNVKTNNALGDLTNPVTLSTGSMNFPGGTVISSVIRVWFKVPAIVGASADTLFIRATSTGGFDTHIWDGPTIGTLNWPGVDFSAGTFTFDTSTLTNTQLTNLQLIASYQAAVVATPQTQIQIDAWSIDASEVL